MGMIGTFGTRSKSQIDLVHSGPEKSYRVSELESAHVTVLQVA